MPKPLLTIGIIFRDDIRCIERCLKALGPLRKAMPCELIMADTGSVDGSRQVAEQYADILIDFPWINDFAAARNAVMDRASGKWFFTVDTDEYLDPNVNELRRYLRRSGDGKEDGCAVVQRNYTSFAMDDSYSDFIAVRILRMSTGLRYSGKIHESWSRRDGKPLINHILSNVILHHDGYVGLGGTAGTAKRERNLSLLRQKREDDPDNLLTRLQIVESSAGQDGQWDELESAVELVEAKKHSWQTVGPVLLRYAVTMACAERPGDALQWAGRAEEMFPDSPFTRVDVNYCVCMYHHLKEEIPEVIPYGEAYLKGLAAYHADKSAPELFMSSIYKANRVCEMQIRTVLVLAYGREGEPEKALEQLECLDCSIYDTKEILQLYNTLKDIHVRTLLDTAPALLAFWEALNRPKPSREMAKKRRRALLREAVGIFSAKAREDETGREGFRRPAFTLFLPLAEQCEFGRAASILDTTDTEVIEDNLAHIQDWNEFPIQALLCALQRGARYPLPAQPLSLEEMDRLAGRLSSDADGITALACDVAEGRWGTMQELSWARGLVMAAVRAIDWKTADGRGMAVAGAFAKVEGAFLRRCYTPEALDDSSVLPPMHRLGWYCARAFEGLERGSTADYVHFLRGGLNAYPAMKPMVKYLIDHTPQLRKADEELKALADRLRSLLASYAPDDPAVEALKQSEAYRKVADLVEGIPVPIVGNLPS